jgi:hypothetical protein
MSIEPLGVLALAEASAARTSSSPMPYWNSGLGLSSTRTAGSELPPTCTWPMPDTCDSFCARMVCAASYSCPVVSVPEVSVMIRIGASAGFILR